MTTAAQDLADNKPRTPRKQPKNRVTLQDQQITHNFITSKMKTPNKVISKESLLMPMRVRPTEQQRLAIDELVTKSNLKASEIVRRALSLGLPWVEELTLWRRMRSMKENLEQIGKDASECKKQTNLLVHLIGMFDKVPNTPTETQIQINNLLSLGMHIAELLGKRLDANTLMQEQLTHFEPLEPQDCREICYYLDKVAEATASPARKLRINKLSQLFRTVGGI